MTTEYTDYLISPTWHRFRQSILVDRPCCEACGAPKDLQLHHLSYRNIYHEEPEDVVVLCSSCHTKAEEMIAKKEISRSHTESRMTLKAKTLRLLGKPRLFA